MATACVLSFPEVEGGVVEVVVEQWDPQGEGMAPPPDALRTGLLCQVSDEFLPLQVFSLPPQVYRWMYESYATFFLSGLPPSGSWQDLKDHMRDAGEVCYADVYRDGTGLVEFVRKEDMAYAVRKLDNTKFRSHEVRKGLQDRATLIKTGSGATFWNWMFFLNAESRSEGENDWAVRSKGQCEVWRAVYW